MQYESKSTRHAKYLLHAHLVFTPKYCKKIFTKAHFELMGEVFIDVFNSFDAQLVEFDGEKDHVHLLVLYPSRVTISTLANSLKGVSSRMLRENFDIFKNDIGETVLHNGVKVILLRQLVVHPLKSDVIY